MTESPESPRQIREFELIEPTGRRIRFRLKTRKEKVIAALGTGTVLVISLLLWAVQLAPLWLWIASWFR